MNQQHVQLSAGVVELRLRHTFTIAHGSSDLRYNVMVRLVTDGLVAHGVAAPNPRYGETPESAMAALESLRLSLTGNLDAIDPLIRRMHGALAGEYAAKAALDMALHDRWAKTLNQPLYRLFGADPARMPPTSMTIGIDQPTVVRKKVRDAQFFKVLKVKLGGENDREMIETIRSVSQQPIRVDANEGWHQRDAALREIEWLAQQGIELIEQPMPADRHADMRWLKRRSPLPLIADEAFALPADLPRLAEGYHGVNIKLAKCGGMLAARQAIAMARALDMQTMLGCMVESSVGIAAAAHLAPLVDYVDLDGNLLVANDPFRGHPVRDGVIALSDDPGLGIQPSHLPNP